VECWRWRLMVVSWRSLRTCACRVGSGFKFGSGGGLLQCLWNVWCRLSDGRVICRPSHGSIRKSSGPILVIPTIEASPCLTSQTRVSWIVVVAWAWRPCSSTRWIVDRRSVATQRMRRMYIGATFHRLVVGEGGPGRLAGYGGPLVERCLVI